MASTMSGNVTISTGPDICLPLTVYTSQSTFTIDELAIGIAFLIGLIVGCIIAVLCAKLCTKDIAKKKLQDEEALLVEYKGVPNHMRSGVTQEDQQQGVFRYSDSDDNYASKDSKYIVSSNNGSIKKKKRPTKKRRAKGKQKGQVEEDEEIAIPLISLGNDDDDDAPPISDGLIDALLLTNEDAVDAELSKQDLNSIVNLERELREESIMTMMQLMRTMLNKMLAKGKLSEDEYKDLVKNMQDGVKDAINTNQREREEEEQELMKDSKLAKDPDALEREKDKLHSKYINKMNSQMTDLKDDLRQKLDKNSNLTDEEIELIMADLADNMANLEKKMGMERLRQQQSLEDKLARRRQMAEKQIGEKQIQRNEISYRTETHERVLDTLVKDGKLLDRQKDEILQQYEEDLRRIQMKTDEDLQKQKLSIADKLRKRREERLKKLAEDQEQQKEDFMRKADKVTSTAEVMDAYHDLLLTQRIEREEMSEDIDVEEANDIQRLSQEKENARAREIETREEEMEEILHSKANLSQNEANRIMKMHEKDMDEYERIKKAEKKRMRQMMEEKLEQRKRKSEENNKIALAEQQALKDQQDATIGKVLSSQTDLDEEARKKILKEHEQNVNAVNNQLQMSRLRQQKQLEQKLAQRKAKAAGLKEQLEESKRTKRVAKQKDKDKLEQQLTKQIEEEEKKNEDMRKKQVAEMRQRLAAESEAALKDQERHIGLLIARLQVGQARRQALIHKQDQTIKELEEQLGNRVVEQADETGRDDHKVDMVLQQHQREVTNLTEKMLETKDHQEQLLRERLEARRLKKERAVENKLENEAQEEWENSRDRGAGLATSILSQVMLEQRHKSAMRQLEKEMAMEMQKQREELNQELESEMAAELRDQKKSFLAQLAAISNMDKNEVTDIVENVVADTGGNEKQAKKLAKELREEMKRAKSNLGDDRDYDRSKLRRAKTDLYDEEDDYRNQRPKSSKKRPKSAFREDDYDNRGYDDDDYDNRGRNKYYNDDGYDDEYDDRHDRYNKYDR